MILFSVCIGLYSVYAAGKEEHRCQLLDFLYELSSEFRKDRDRLLALLESVARAGPPKNPEISHRITDKIFQFSRGRLRVLYFYDEGRMIICTHCFMKRSQKTPRREIDHAISEMKRYFEDKKRGAITIIREEGE